MVPIVGVAREISGPVARTPQYKRWPALGALLVATQITSTQQQSLSIAFTDAKGNPAPVDGVPTWGVDNTDVLAITPAADGMSCVIAAVGPLGSARVSLQADADLGAGVQPVAGTYDVEVTAGKAVAVVITGGAISEQS